METSIVLIVEGVDLEDLETLIAVSERFDDLAWSSHDGQAFATLFTTAPDPVAHAASVAARIAEHVPGAQVTGVDEQLVSVGDIADRANVTPEAIRLWAAGKRRSGNPFPRPRGRISQGRTQMKVWAWGEVHAWLRAEYKIPVEPNLTYLSARENVKLNAILAGIVLEPVLASGQGWQRVAREQAVDAVLHRIDDDLEEAVVGRVRASRFTYA